MPKLSGSSNWNAASPPEPHLLTVIALGVSLLLTPLYWLAVRRLK